MPHIVAISGSLRSGSYNTRLLRAAARLAPEGCTVEEGSIREFPLYDGDVEAASGVPAAVAALKDRIAAADALLLVSPEYNHSIPGVLKNAIDWMSRPPRDIPRVFGGKLVGLIGASGGRGGTRFAQVAWLPVLHTLGCAIFSGRDIYVANARDVFADDGTVTDDRTQELVAEYMKRLAERCARR